MCVCGLGWVGFHTMFLLALVPIFLYLAVLFMCVRLCVVRPFGALLRILNILARHTILFPRFVGIAYSESVCTLCGWGAVGFHTMFLFDLVSVFFHFTALCTFRYACVGCSLGALRRIFNILVRLFIVSPWSVAATYLLRFCCFFFFFSSCISRCSEPMEEYGGYMVVVCVCGHAF